MPLKPGKSQKVIGENIGELVDTYKSKGKIGNTTPKNAEHARKIAAAIAYDKAEKSKESKMESKQDMYGMLFDAYGKMTNVMTESAAKACQKMFVAFCESLDPKVKTWNDKYYPEAVSCAKKVWKKIAKKFKIDYKLASLRPSFGSYGNSLAVSFDATQGKTKYTARISVFKGCDENKSGTIDFSISKNKKPDGVWSDSDSFYGNCVVGDEEQCEQMIDAVGLTLGFVDPTTTTYGKGW
jgi:hypothetical protein